ncbi:MAG: NADH-quinone oxidoreductase subunit NuoH [Chloroflexi bacterium HGW-Chloroflexi-1]|nr:MAG: NADH-quinone oxidoreductase subunit NuoH [Chloroflexi bacterium HGW-Chloroflexi-1]
MDFIRDFFVNLANAWTTWISGGLPPWAVTVVNYLVVGIILVLMPVIATLTLTWMERKVIGRIQNRIGPNRVGPWGIFQAIADAVKMLIKEDIIPDNADRPVFNLAPILIAAAAALLWAVIPFGRGMIGQDLNIGALYLIAIGSISTVAVLMAGWSSNNKFALVGAFRVVAQLLSYEVPMVLSIAAVVLLAGSMKMGQIVEGQVVPFGLVLPLALIIYLLAAIAETGRAPFDLLEADSEIVAGYFIEYSGLKFGWFYIAEYSNLMAVSAIATTLFLGGWRGPGVAAVPALGPFYFAAKTLVVIFVLMWIRGTWPRFRIDQMLAFAWKALVPASLANLLWIAVMLKLPVPPGVQWALMLAGNIGILAVTLGLLGQAAQRHAERQGLVGA